tara:strand:- start:165 stop:1187 length:1023 start_codon:yes stop_codon:yes gene_type:complete
MLSNKINSFSVWLMMLGFSVVCIILIGGYTRISDSGLSITEWLPVSGILYPFSEAAWEIEFDKYKKIDEFMLINSSMTLNEFKYIYFWEWFHRAFARFIGFAYLLPVFYLFILNKIPKGFYINILLIGALIGIQAVVGWYMVKSGLSGRVDVSQYRLFLHLSIAFIILGLIFYSLLRFLYENEVSKNLVKFNRSLSLLFVLIFSQIVYGAFVSGTDSGLLYNTWPYYNGNLVPNELITKDSYLLNFFENGEFILFNHRTFALVILITIIYINFAIINTFTDYKTLILIICFDIFFLIQVGIGIWMTIWNLPWYLALAHQGNSVILFLLSIYMWFLSKKPS